MEGLEFFGLEGNWAVMGLSLAVGYFALKHIWNEHRKLKDTVYAHKAEREAKDIDLERRIQSNEHNMHEAKSAHTRLEGGLRELHSEVQQNNVTLQAVKEQGAEILGRLLGIKEKG